MKTVDRTSAGFTAVELLITMLIASMFLFAGYQLYTQVMKDGAETNKTALVSNLASERMQKQVRLLSGPCASSGPTEVKITEAGIGEVTYTDTVSCPNMSATPNLKRVKIEASYGTNPVIKVAHATFTQ